MKKSFIHPDFLLNSTEARTLFHDYASECPIVDYHCHLPPKDVALDRKFANLYEIWLEGDHYKWRAMRTNGISENLCTGDADPYEKFLAFAKTVPHTLRNPIYHWSHIELKRYFDIDVLLNENTAHEIWEETKRKLASPELSAQGILKKFNVQMVGTTDDPADSLEWHESIAKAGIPTRVLPTFRPDMAFGFQSIVGWNVWIDKLSQTSGIHIKNVATLLQALHKRHDDFAALGCRMSDHGIEQAVYEPCSDVQAGIIFDKARSGQKINLSDFEQFATYILQHTARWNAQKGWVMQLHIGALRNNRNALFKKIGKDIGCDSISDAPQGRALSSFLDSLDDKSELPKTILYNLNPADNYLFATMIGNFQDGSIPGKIQFGSGWWFLDQLEGMEMQINALSNLGLLSRFVGMITDSRSFMSYPRHEYFRRLLCNILGRDMATGLIPDDFTLVGEMVRRICFLNAQKYLNTNHE